MKCRFPLQIKSGDGFIYVPCGKCAWCLSRIRDQWFFRLKQEKKDHLFTSFVTLTYRDEDLPCNVDSDGVLHPTVFQPHITQYHKNLRKKYNFRFMVTSEYGSRTHRPHYHGIYFHDEPIDFCKGWSYGDNNSQYPAKDGSFKYVLKYILKGSNVPDGANPNFRTMSRRPGLGSSLDLDNEIDKGFRFLQIGNGQYVSMPRYYKKQYEKRTNAQLIAYAKERNLEYLRSVDQFSSLRVIYQKQLDSGYFDSSYSFEQWLSDQYHNDFVKQVKINNKNE